jgi:hypothetical protein
MPRFYNPDDPDLSDLNRAKKSVNRDYAKQYQAQDGLHDNLGQTVDKDAKFNTLTTRLTNLYTSLVDFGQALNVPVAILANPIASFRPAQVGQLQQLSSRILSEVRALSTVFSSLKTFNIFTPPEAEQLQQYVQEINDAQGLIIGASQALGASPTAREIDGLVNVFNSELMLLLQFLNGASKNYRATEKIGGAIVPAYNGEGRFGSDGYKIGDFYTYSAPRRFY